MANRSFVRNTSTLEKAPVRLFARVTFGSSGAPTLDKAKSKGVKSISRTSAGLYVITLQDSYQRLLNMKHLFLNATAPAAPGMYLVTDATSTNSAPAVTVQFNAAGTATDPGSGEEVRLTFELSNSTAV
jgi:hypothetical protein